MRLAFALVLVAPLAGCAQMHAVSADSGGGEFVVPYGLTGSDPNAYMRERCPSGFQVTRDAMLAPVSDAPPDARPYYESPIREHRIAYVCTGRPVDYAARFSDAIAERDRVPVFALTAASTAMGEAADSAAACGTGAPSEGVVRVTFAPTGAASQVDVIEGEIGDASERACVVERFRSVTVPAFRGQAVSVRKRVRIGVANEKTERASTE